MRRNKADKGVVCFRCGRKDRIPRCARLRDTQCHCGGNFQLQRGGPRAEAEWVIKMRVALRSMPVRRLRAMAFELGGAAHLSCDATKAQCTAYILDAIHTASGE